MRLVPKYPTIPQTIRRFARPETRVHALASLGVSSIRRSQRSGFVSPFSAEEREALVALYSLRNRAQPYNAGAVRLDGVEMRPDGRLVATISQVEFFDFLATNLTVLPSYTPATSWRDVSSRVLGGWHTRRLTDRIAAAVHGGGRPRDAVGVLGIESLANIVAVSLLIEDADGRIGIVRRSRDVCVSSRLFGSTVTGSLNSEDFRATDPFAHCALREASEELGLHDLDLRFDGIAISKQKLQPVFMYSTTVDQRWSDLGATISHAAEFSRESSALFAVPLADAIRFASISSMTDASA